MLIKKKKINKNLVLHSPAAQQQSLLCLWASDATQPNSNPWKYSTLSGRDIFMLYQEERKGRGLEKIFCIEETTKEKCCFHYDMPFQPLLKAVPPAKGQKERTHRDKRPPAHLTLCRAQLSPQPCFTAGSVTWMIFSIRHKQMKLIFPCIINSWLSWILIQELSGYKGQEKGEQPLMWFKSKFRCVTKKEKREKKQSNSLLGV